MFNINKHVTIFCSALFIVLTPVSHAMTISGPVIANNVTVSGDVTMSSTTVSTMTIGNFIQLPETYNGIRGRVLQLIYSSTTYSTSTNSTSFLEVSSMTQSIQLSNANNLVRITVSGTIFSNPPSNDGPQFGHLTVYRDTTNLGDATNGFVFATGLSDFALGGPAYYPGNSNARITIIDAPGNTGVHTYKVCIASSNTISYVAFPYQTGGYLILEEISQ
jgi:hypothetical protein